MAVRSLTFDSAAGVFIACSSSSRGVRPLRCLRVRLYDFVYDFVYEFVYEFVYKFVYEFVKPLP